MHWRWALAAAMEARVKAAGFDADARFDRNAFRVRLRLREGARAAPFVAALQAAFARPVEAGSPVLTLTAQPLASL